MPSGIYTRTKEHNRKIAKSRKGIIFSEEHCRNISKSKKGKNRILREIRTCKRQKCNNKFKVIITSIKRYCSHSCAGKDQKRKPHSEEAKRKIGENNAMKNRPEIRAKTSKSLKGRTYRELFGAKETRRRLKEMSQSMKRTWQKPEFITKQMRARGVTPNRVEKQLSNMLKKLLPFEYKYVGDGEIILGGKCPDFINVNGQKKIIEMFGDYWHGEEKTGRTKKQEENQRIKHFAKYGYKTLIVWQSELKNMPKLKRKLVQFHNT